MPVVFVFILSVLFSVVAYVLVQAYHIPFHLSFVDATIMLEIELIKLQSYSFLMCDLEWQE